MVGVYIRIINKGDGHDIKHNHSKHMERITVERNGASMTYGGDGLKIGNAGNSRNTLISHSRMDGLAKITSGRRTCNQLATTVSARHASRAKE